MASTIVAAVLRSLVVALHYRLRHTDRHPRRRRPAALILNGEGLQLTADSHEPFVSGVETVFRQIDDIAFEVGDGDVRIYEIIDGRDLADFGLVQVVTYPRPTGTLLNAITDYLRHHRVRAVNMAGVSAPNKLHQYVRFAQAGLAVPKTAYLPRRLLVRSYPDIVDRLGLPFVLKSISASGGKFNYLVGNEPDFASILRDPDHCAVHFLAQEFIPKRHNLSSPGSRPRPPTCHASNEHRRELPGEHSYRRTDGTRRSRRACRERSSARHQRRPPHRL